VEICKIVISLVHYGVNWIERNSSVVPEKKFRPTPCSVTVVLCQVLLTGQVVLPATFWMRNIEVETCPEASGVDVSDWFPKAPEELEAAPPAWQEVTYPPVSSMFLTPCGSSAFRKTRKVSFAVALIFPLPEIDVEVPVVSF
jgi:hypothetical protein